jgi:hypothetical protein
MCQAITIRPDAGGQPSGWPVSKRECLPWMAPRTDFPFYLPGISREDLRDPEDLPTELQPLAAMRFDTDTKGVSTPIAEMGRILAEHPDYSEVIFPYIGGEELNTSTTHAHHRYVINFGERTEENCRRRWPELMAIVEAKVKLERMQNNREVRKRYWWRFGETTPALFAAIVGLDRVIVISSVGQHGSFALVPARMVFSHSLIVFPFSSYSAFCSLQARPHEIWARFFGSSMKDDLRYTPSDCFETFPFPEGWESRPSLEAAGKAYYEFRAALMVRNHEGLTKTYNRFHDPDERDSHVVKLR